jgi:hypothetical protein
MHDRYWLPGSVSVRAQLGIRAEDPNIFRTYTLAEAIKCAKVLAADRSISLFVRALLPVGLCLDLRPGHISATIASIAQACCIGARTVRQHRAMWECVDSAIRFDAVQRSCGLILTWRGSTAAPLF